MSHTLEQKFVYCLVDTRFATFTMHLAIKDTLACYTHRWRNRGGRMGLGPPYFYFWGPGPLLFCLNIVSLSNTINIGSSDKVNRLMKKMLQNFGSLL